MTPWTPAPEWEGQDAYLIGGGSSLSSFDFSRLKGKNTLGCNDAFRLGPEICRWCVFGDASWFQKNADELGRFHTQGGQIVTNSPSFRNVQLPILHQMEKVKLGLATGSKLGWNYSTGAIAINFAISLGAKLIYLLGYDLKNIQGNHHWHDKGRAAKDEVFQRFLRGFQAINAGLKDFPGVRIVNVTDGTSQLPFFPRLTIQEVFP